MAASRRVAGQALAWLGATLVAASAAPAEPGLVRVEVVVESESIAMLPIRPEPVRQRLAEAVAADLEIRFKQYWRFTVAPLVPEEPGLVLRVLDGTAGEVLLRLDRAGMTLEAGARPWTHVWYPPGALATEDLPTAATGPELITAALGELLETHGPALRAALKTVPVGVGAVWFPGNERWLVLGLPWQRFEENQDVFRISCSWRQPGGVDVPVTLISAGLGTAATFEGGQGQPFQALLAMPKKRFFAGDCKEVDDILDEVRTFSMGEILLEKEVATDLLEADPGC